MPTTDFLPLTAAASLHISSGDVHQDAATGKRLASLHDVHQAPASLHISSGDVHQDAATGERPASLHHDHQAPASHHISSGDVHQVAVSQEAVGQEVTACTPSALNPDVAPFQVRDKSLVHHGTIYPNLVEDWDHVQRVMAGGVGNDDEGTARLWASSSSRNIPTCRGAELLSDNSEPILPYQMMDDIPAELGLATKQVHKVNSLPDMQVKMPGGIFIDKALPAPVHNLEVNQTFTGDYYVALHNITAAPGMRQDGSSYPAYTPNHIGARVSMPHVRLNLNRWRYHLTGYPDMEIIQFLEYGFPLGLSSLPDLECTPRNHGSAYMWFEHVDKFVCTEITEGGLSGPFQKAPWWNTIISPLMTAHKKVRSRRTVFDATFGERSLNNSTPSDYYMGLPCKYTFPKIQDYKEMILKCGPGCWMWKRDLSRFFLQLPLDPTEYHRVGIVWRGLFLFFVALAFGLRHSGLQGQKVTDSVAWIHRRLGLETAEGLPYQVINYSDDLGGVEESLERAIEAFNKLGWLLTDLGLEESLKKAEAPSQTMTYLGVEFDSVKMTMSVPPEKVTEIKAEIRLWVRKTSITRKDLQSLLGKLFWISKVVRYSRPFMGRLLAQLRTMTSLKDGKKVKLFDESRKDILWWMHFLDEFNGINMIVNEDPIPLSFEQLLDEPHSICAGDATPTGGGAWHGKEYWCGGLPVHLQDTQVPIHLKEFWILIVSAKQWGDTWTGRAIVLYCDNDSVCDTVVHRKPKDPALLSLLREFLFIVVTKKFFPVVRKIDTKKNEIADHISRRFDEEAAAKTFAKFGLNDMLKIKPRADFFKLTAPW